MRSKTGKKQPFWAPFSRPSKTAIFDHFSCVDEFWRLHDVLRTNFDDEIMLITCRWWCRWRKSCSRGQKLTKNRPHKTLKKNDKKLEPGTGGENPRSGRVTRSVHDAIAWAELARYPFEKKKKKKKDQHGNGTSSASVAMCEAFFDTCAAYSHEWLIPHVRLMKAGACERSEVRAGIIKSPWGFFWYEVSWRHTG
jgi:hypothetical protein